MSKTDPTGKAALRSVYRCMRLALTPGERARLSRFACGHVLRTVAWKKAACVALYMAVKGETDASDLMKAAWAEGKTVLLPVCSPDTEGEMRCYPCPGPEALRPGRYGIPEPAVAEAGCLSPASGRVPDMFIVPGVAFTATGRRLGQGGGYYDRLLAEPQHSGILRMGLAYGFQIVPDLPAEAWDMPLHAIATEKGILWV